MNHCILLLLLLPSLALADSVYRTLDEQGNVIFTDQPSPGAERIEIKQAPAVEFRKIEIPERRERQQQKTEQYYQELFIQQPSIEQTIHDNQGNLSVSVAVVPELKQGHRLLLELDGQQIAEQAAPLFQLQNIDRGAHAVSVRILDQNGQTVLASAPVTFYLRRVSKLTGPLSNQSNVITPLNPPRVSPGGITPTRPPGGNVAAPVPATQPRL